MTYPLLEGDEGSGVALLEAVSRKYEGTLGMRDPALVTLNKRAYNLFKTLSPEDRAQVNPDLIHSSLPYQYHRWFLLINLQRGLVGLSADKIWRTSSTA